MMRIMEVMMALASVDFDIEQLSKRERKLLTVY
jgi:hypothetical protein